MEVVMKKSRYMIGIVFLSVILFSILARLPMVYAISQYGSNGEEVKQIQTKLQAWGYYNGAIDGVYGSRNV